MDCKTLCALFLADFSNDVSLPGFLQMNWSPSTPVLSGLSPFTQAALCAGKTHASWSLLAGCFTPQVSAEVSFEAFLDAELDESLTETFLYSTVQHFKYFLYDF